MSEGIPEGWQEHPLGEVLIDVRNGCSLHQNGTGLGVPVTRIETISDEKINFSRVGYLRTDDNIERYRLLEGDILFSHINSLSHIAKSAIFHGERPLYHGMNLLRFRIDSTKTDAEFLHFVISSDAAKRDFRARAKSAINQASLNVHDIRSSAFLFPSIAEQQKIASILTSVDEVIEKTEAQISKLQDLKKGMMQELLTKGIGHTEFKDSPVGRIPKEWKSVEFNSLATIKHGFAFSGEYFSTEPSEYTLLTPGNFHRDGHLYFGSNTKYFTGEIPQEFVLENGDVLVVMTDLTKEMTILGNSVVLNTKRKVLHNQRIGKVQMLQKDNSRISRDYLNVILNSFYVKKHVKGTATGTTVRHTSPTKILEPLIPLPPLSEQEEIVRVLDSIQHDLVLCEEKNESTHILKKALMQDLLTGKVRVKVS
jgi:type I restriction enzyme S subunit